MQITPASLLVWQKVSPQPEWAQNWILDSFPRHDTKSNHNSEFSDEGGYVESMVGLKADV